MSQGWCHHSSPYIYPQAHLHVTTTVMNSHLFQKYLYVDSLKLTTKLHVLSCFCSHYLNGTLYPVKSVHVYFFPATCLNFPRPFTSRSCRVNEVKQTHAPPPLSPRMPPLRHTCPPFTMHAPPLSRMPPLHHTCPPSPCMPPFTTHAPPFATHAPQACTPWEQPRTPPLWTECGHTLLKILPCPNFVAGGNEPLWHSLRQ